MRKTLAKNTQHHVHRTMHSIQKMRVSLMIAIESTTIFMATKWIMIYIYSTHSTRPKPMEEMHRIILWYELLLHLAKRIYFWIGTHHMLVLNWIKYYQLTWMVGWLARCFSQLDLSGENTEKCHKFETCQQICLICILLCGHECSKPNASCCFFFT